MTKKFVFNFRTLIRDKDTSKRRMTPTTSFFCECVTLSPTFGLHFYKIACAGEKNKAQKWSDSGGYGCGCMKMEPFVVLELKFTISPFRPRIFASMCKKKLTFRKTREGWNCRFQKTPRTEGGDKVQAVSTQSIRKKFQQFSRDFAGVFLENPRSHIVL